MMFLSYILDHGNIETFASELRSGITNEHIIIDSNNSQQFKYITK